MTLKGHKKHTALARPQLGMFGRNEWAFLGASCDTIKQLTSQIINALSVEANIAFVDAQHDDETTLSTSNTQLVYTQRTTGPQLNFNIDLNKFQRNALLNNYDLILINGNHHAAHKQVVIINSLKKISLQKRLDQLTNVGLFLLDLDEPELFDFVKTAIPQWGQIPVYHLHETDKIIDFFKIQLKAAPLKGLVLAGGKSERMGCDKGEINFHGQAQRYHMANLLKQVTSEAFISCRAGQQLGINPNYRTLPDTFIDLGPFGAILSAFRQEPESAWLVVACDLPLLDKGTIDYLIANRNPSAVATAFISERDGLPEPLITIWEPQSYPILLSFLSQGYSCPRKVLINTDTFLIKAPDPLTLTNVNTPEDLANVQTLVAKQQQNV